MTPRFLQTLDALPWDDEWFYVNDNDMEDQCRCYGCGHYTINPALHVNPATGDHECGEQYA
jgi:hypothetical protein